MRQVKYLGINSEKNNEIYRKLVLNEELNSAIEKIRKEFSIPDIDDMSREEWLSFNEDYRLLIKSEEIINKFKLPKTWIDIVHQYIVDDNFIHEKNPDGLRLVTEINYKGEGEYYIRIFPHTSIKDIKDVWFLIQNEINKDKVKTKKKKTKKFNRNESIYDFYLKGKSALQIRFKIRSEYGEDLSVNNIRTIIHNHKKIRQLKKHKK